MIINSYISAKTQYDEMHDKIDKAIMQIFDDIITKQYESPLYYGWYITDNNLYINMRVKDKTYNMQIVENYHVSEDLLQKYMDKAVSKGLIKTNTADREKSRLTQKIKNMK